MMAIGPFWRKRMALLGVVPLLAVAGCGEGYDVARRQAAEPPEMPADETCRFERSGQTRPVSRASWLMSLDTVTPKHWPAGMYKDFRKHQELKRARGSRAPDWPGTAPAPDEAFGGRGLRAHCFRHSLSGVPSPSAAWASRRAEMWSAAPPPHFDRRSSGIRIRFSRLARSSTCGILGTGSRS